MTLRRSARSNFMPGAGFLEGADHLVAGPFGKRGEIPFLARTGLVGGRDPAIEGDALSQLNSSRWMPRNPLFLLGHEP